MINVDGINLRELRCSNCHKLICHENVVAGVVVYDCPRCKERNVFHFKYLKSNDNNARLNQLQVQKKGGE